MSHNKRGLITASSNCSHPNKTTYTRHFVTQSRSLLTTAAFQQLTATIGKNPKCGPHVFVLDDRGLYHADSRTTRPGRHVCLC